MQQPLWKHTCRWAKAAGDRWKQHATTAAAPGVVPLQGALVMLPFAPEAAGRRSIPVLTPNQGRKGAIMRPQP